MAGLSCKLCRCDSGIVALKPCDTRGQNTIDVFHLAVFSAGCYGSAAGGGGVQVIRRRSVNTWEKTLSLDTHLENVAKVLIDGPARLLDLTVCSATSQVGVVKRVGRDVSAGRWVHSTAFQAGGRTYSACFYRRIPQSSVNRFSITLRSCRDELTL